MVRGVGRLWERRNVVFRQKFICGDSPEGRGIVVVQDPVAGAPLLRAMSANSVAEALQERGGVAGMFCRFPYLPSVL